MATNKVKTMNYKINRIGQKIDSSNSAPKDFVFGDGNFRGLVNAESGKKK